MTNPLTRGPITTAFGLAILAALYFNLVIEKQPAQLVPHGIFGVLAVILIGIKDDVLSVVVFWRSGGKEPEKKCE